MLLRMEQRVEEGLVARSRSGRAVWMDIDLPADRIGERPMRPDAGVVILREIDAFDHGRVEIEAAYRLDGLGRVYAEEAGRHRPAGMAFL